MKWCIGRVHRHAIGISVRYVVVAISLSPHSIVIKINIPQKTGIQGDAVPLVGSRGKAPCGVWGNAPTVTLMGLFVDIGFNICVKAVRNLVGVDTECDWFGNI